MGAWLAIIGIIVVWGLVLRHGLRTPNRRHGRFYIAYALIVFSALLWSVYRVLTTPN